MTVEIGLNPISTVSMCRVAGFEIELCINLEILYSFI